MSPAGLAAVANEVVLAGRRSIVELGSGVSTVVLARLARQLGGRIVAVEHSPGGRGGLRGRWIATGSTTSRRWSRRRCDRIRSASRARRGTTPRCSRAQLPAEGIELLLVDGPPGYGEGMELQPPPGAAGAGRAARRGRARRPRRRRPARRAADPRRLGARDGLDVRPPAGRADRDRASSPQLELVLEPGLARGAERVVDATARARWSAVVHIRQGAPCSRARAAARPRSGPGPRRCARASGVTKRSSRIATRAAAQARPLPPHRREPGRRAVLVARDEQHPVRVVRGRDQRARPSPRSPSSGGETS